MCKVTKMGPAWSSPHRQGVNRPVHGATRIRSEPMPFRRESIAIMAKERHMPRAYQATFFKRKVSFLQAQNVGLHIFRGFRGFGRFCCGESLQESSPNHVPGNWPRSARMHSWRRVARRRVPSDPLARGEQTPHLVTCWSSDALRLSSSGRTGPKSPPLSIVRRGLHVVVRRHF